MNAHSSITAIATADTVRERISGATTAAREFTAPADWWACCAAYKEKKAASLAYAEGKTYEDTQADGLHFQAMAAFDELMLWPAPTLEAVATKLAMFAAEAAHELKNGPVYQAQITADAVRLANRYEHVGRLPGELDEQIEWLSDSRDYPQGEEATKLIAALEILEAARKDINVRSAAPAGAFGQVLANFEAKLADLNQGDVDDDAVTRPYSEAYEALADSEPATATEFLKKFRALWGGEASPDDQAVSAMMEDAERLLKAGDTTIQRTLAYWTEEQRSGVGEASAEVAEAAWQRAKAYERDILAQPITCARDAAAKLRVALINGEQSAVGEQIIAGIVEAEEIPLEDAIVAGNRMAYSIIRELEKFDG
jgi:hypothetical protein